MVSYNTKDIEYFTEFDVVGVRDPIPCSTPYVGGIIDGNLFKSRVDVGLIGDFPFSYPNITHSKS